MDIVFVTISWWVRVTMTIAAAVLRLAVMVTAVLQAARVSLHPILALKHIS